MDKTAEIMNATDIPDHSSIDEGGNDEIINIDSQPSGAASPIEIEDETPNKVVDLCNDTPVRRKAPHVNLDGFRYEEVDIGTCEGKGSSYSK